MVAASGLVYLAAAILDRPGEAWAAFVVTFVLMGLSKVVVAFDPAPWLIGPGALLLVVALIRTPRGPSWATPLQSAAMLALAASAAFAVQLDATMGGIVVAIALLGHAAWDVHHHRTRRVVSLSLAEFCAVLDVLLAILVAVVSIAAT